MRYKPSTVTPLGRFMLENRITNQRLANAAGLSTVTIYQLRRGLTEPRRQILAAITRAASTLTGRRVRASELFDLGSNG